MNVARALNGGVCGGGVGGSEVALASGAGAGGDGLTIAEGREAVGFRLAGHRRDSESQDCGRDAPAHVFAPLNETQDSGFSTRA
jgi:hypothetical protein